MYFDTNEEIASGFSTSILVLGKKRKVNYYASNEMEGIIEEVTHAVREWENIANEN